MALKFINRSENDHGISLSFEGSAAELASAAGDFFASRKYKLKSGSPESGVYERGNYVLRLLFGAFVAYYKFNVSINSSAGTSTLLLSKAHSGFSGGVIGMAKLKKEFKMVADGLERADSALGIYANN